MRLLSHIIPKSGDVNTRRGPDTNGNESSVRNSVRKLASRLSQRLRSRDAGPDLCNTTKSSTDQESAMRKAPQVSLRSGNDDLNYTKGPVRIVHVSDGVNDDCAALLLNVKFNSSIKAAIRAKEDFEDTLHVVQNQSVASDSLRHQLEDSFIDSRSRIAQLLANAAHAVRDQYREEGIALQIALKVVNEDLGKIDDALRKESNQRQDYHNILQARFTDVCKRQGLANDHLERAFIHARLWPSQKQSSNSQRSCEDKSDDQGRLKGSLNVAGQDSESDSITLCDSWSTIATPDKSKIGMWRKICAAAGKQARSL